MVAATITWCAVHLSGVQVNPPRWRCVRKSPLEFASEAYKECAMAERATGGHANMVTQEAVLRLLAADQDDPDRVVWLAGPDWFGGKLEDFVLEGLQTYDIVFVVFYVSRAHKLCRHAPPTVPSHLMRACMDCIGARQQRMQPRRSQRREEPHQGGVHPNGGAVRHPIQIGAQDHLGLPGGGQASGRAHEHVLCGLSIGRRPPWGGERRL